MSGDEGEAGKSGGSITARPGCGNGLLSLSAQLHRPAVPAPGQVASRSLNTRHLRGYCQIELGEGRGVEGGSRPSPGLAGRPGEGALFFILSRGSGKPRYGGGTQQEFILNSRNPAISPPNWRGRVDISPEANFISINLKYLITYLNSAILY